VSEAEWRSIAEGLYEVSSDGRVRRVEKRTNAVPGRDHKLYRNPNGYLYVCLSVRGKATTYRVHRLVAEAFLGPRPEGTEINHRDGNKANNAVANLEYVSHQANIDHAFATGLSPVGERYWATRSRESVVRGEAHPRARLTADAVREIRSAIAARRESARSLAARFGVQECTIYDVSKRKSWKHVA